MDVGQVKTGHNAEDTFNKMLQCIHMSTHGVANAVQNEYPSVQALATAFAQEGDEILKNIPVTSNRAGNATGRALGPSMSKKIARVFRGIDEWDLES